MIKHSPEWPRPLILANATDIIVQPSQHSLWELLSNGVALVTAITQNLPAHCLHIRYMCRATRRIKAELRYAIAFVCSGIIAIAVFWVLVKHPTLPVIILCAIEFLLLLALGIEIVVYADFRRGE